MSGFADLSPMMGNLQLAGAAGGWAFWSAMDAFRYRSDSKYYDGGELKSGDTNYWKMSDMLRLYSGLAIGGVLMVTSLMAAFGISPALNAMLWMWMGLVGMIIGLVVGVLRFLGYDAAYSHYDGKAYGSAEHLKGAAVMGQFDSDATSDLIGEALTAGALMGAWESVSYGLWMGATDAEQEASIAEWEEAIATRAEEIATARAAMAPAAAEEKGEEAAEEGAEEGEEEAADGEGDAEEGDAEDAAADGEEAA